MVLHHVKYKEIHGYDEIIELSKSDHVKLHARLRKDGKCNIPVDKLRKISNAPSNRIGYRNEKIKEYKKKNYFSKSFSIPIEKDVSVVQAVEFNIKTGNIGVYSRFLAWRGYRAKFK